MPHPKSLTVSSRHNRETGRLLLLLDPSFASLPEVVSERRCAVNNIKNITATKKAIKKAFQNQIDKKGFSLIEVVSSCPTNWGMTPQNALKWLEENMIPYYPLGVYKDRSSEKEAK